MFILATEVQQNIEQNVEELDKKVSRFSTVIDDGINKAIDFGFDLFHCNSNIYYWKDCSFSCKKII